MRKWQWKSITNVFLLAMFCSAPVLFAAVGCDLNDPDRDVARLFPGSSGYITKYFSVKDHGGPPLFAKIQDRLGDSFRGLYETIDVPYTVYEVFRGNQKIGYIHGVNEKGRYGGIQVFLVLDLDGVIRNFYFQKLTSRYAKNLRSEEFGKQFIGLSLKDFYRYDVLTGTIASGSGVARIKNPLSEAEEDFRAALRGTKKNLILMDEFVFGNRYLSYFTQRGARTP